MNDIVVHITLEMNVRGTICSAMASECWACGAPRNCKSTDHAEILFLAQPMSRTRAPQMLNFGSGRGPRRRTCECSPVPCLCCPRRWTRSAACWPSPTFLLFAEKTTPLHFLKLILTQLGAPLARSHARRSLTWPCWPPRRGQKVGDVTHREPY